MNAFVLSLAQARGAAGLLRGDRERRSRPSTSRTSTAHFAGHHACEPSDLGLFNRHGRGPARRSCSRRTSFYVRGGNTASLLAVWRAHGLDRVLREAWEAGIVLSGGSAGSLCWFECGTTNPFDLERFWRHFKTAWGCCPAPTARTTTARRSAARSYHRLDRGRVPHARVRDRQRRGGAGVRGDVVRGGGVLRTARLCRLPRDRRGCRGCPWPPGCSRRIRRHG